MTVEYFGKQYEITPAVRDEVELGLTKLTKILGENIKSKVILSVEKHRNIAEITVKRRRGHLVGLAEAPAPRRPGRPPPRAEKRGDAAPAAPRPPRKNGRKKKKKKGGAPGGRKKGR